MRNGLSRYGRGSDIESERRQNSSMNVRKKFRSVYRIGQQRPNKTLISEHPAQRKSYNL